MANTHNSTTFHASIHPTHTIYYYRTHKIDLGFATFEQYEEWKRNLLEKRKQQKALGELSNKSTSRLTRSLNWLAYFSPWQPVYAKKENKQFWFKMNFITLTLPTLQQHSDDYIKIHCLQPFLKWIKRSHGADHYVWKAETQDNGNIHFHITTNTFIHWKSIRRKWNEIMAAHGYCKVFQDGSNDKGDAATQVKAVKNHNQIIMYLRKYFTKNDTMKKSIRISDNMTAVPPENYYLCMASIAAAGITEMKRIVDGRVWSVSNSLAGLKVDYSIKAHVDDEVMKHHNRHVIERVDTKQYCQIGYHFARDRLNFHPVIREKFLEIKKQIQGNRGKKQKIFIDSLN
jgi:hypothetical protein